MSSKSLPIVIAVLILILVAAVLASQGLKNRATEAVPSAASPSPAAVAPSPISSASPETSPSVAAEPNKEQKVSNTNPDLTTDANGLSKATVVMTTTQGVIKFKFYPKDAPNTTKRIIELINQGFYNNLAFHRVVPGFVIQGGDPLGNGTGGSGQKQKAEFNQRKHVEGTVAMARAADPDSADSQFYISLGTHPHLDRNYTVFGQVIDGLDVARKIKVGDKMTAVVIE